MTDGVSTGEWVWGSSISHCTHCHVAQDRHIYAILQVPGHKKQKDDTIQAHAHTHTHTSPFFTLIFNLEHETVNMLLCTK